MVVGDRWKCEWKVYRECGVAEGWSLVVESMAWVAFIGRILSLGVVAQRDDLLLVKIAVQWKYGHSDASRLQNCGNSAEYIYWLHKWKAGAPIRLQKMRTGHIFRQPVQPPFFFFFHSNLALCVWLCMIGQLLIARPITSIVLGKPVIFHGGCRADNMKWTVLDFSISLSRKQKIVAAKE